MSNIINFIIDGKECSAEAGKYIVEAARENGIYIPTLCNIPGVKPRGSCRICSVRVNGRLMSACTTPVTDGMEIENNIDEINDIRKAIVEALFVSGNHFCPSCEKSGNCELQALGYRFLMMVPRFPYLFPEREIDASNSKIVKDQNRCIQCKRCIRTIKDDQGRSLFAYRKRGHHVEVVLDPVLGEQMTDELAEQAMEICPVGSIIVKEKGFAIPVGQRKYDTKPIGSEIENK
jgi:[NiFe] hydrogenase diaphorase moiety small subunit